MRTIKTYSKRAPFYNAFISPGSRKDESAPITVIALPPPVPFHLLGKLKSSTSFLTRSF
jgi:hypothetical protein